MENRGDLLTFLARHFVSLVFYDRSPQLAGEHGGAGRLHCLSGFLVRVRDLVYLMTAGHALAEIEEALESGQRLEGWRLDDTYCWEAKHKEPIPFDFHSAPRRHIDADGLDYGLIHLSPLYVDNLNANGIKAVGEESWERDWPDHFDAYALLGLPAELVRPIPGAVSRAMAFLPVEHIEDESQVPAKLKHAAPRIFGRVILPGPDEDESSPLRSIVGMSGGPLFAFKVNDKGQVERYWIVAVQAAWDEPSRTIAACPIQGLLRAIAEIMDDQCGEKPK
jgi:hypothetical protein